MTKIFYILFLLPTLFSCQNEKNAGKYSLFVEDIHIDKDFGNKDFKYKPENNFQYQNAVIAKYFETEKHDQALKNFEKQSKVYDFAENIYFRSKVSKIRNKDYLDLKKVALIAYDDGKTMLEGYTHHFNKIYRKQITEL